MWKKIFAAALILAMNFSFDSANAEQPAANSYRKMFSAGYFYVEFKDEWGTRILASEGDTRMERMRYDFEHSSAIWLNPLGGIFSREEKNPEVMYKDGKFYHFVEKNKANVCEKKFLNHENIDPRQGWNTISQKLALPDELAIFCQNDPFRQKSSAISEPTLKESLKKNLNGKEYDCDRYVCEIKTVAGGEAAQLVYDAVYRDGEIFRVESYIFRNGKSYPVNTLMIELIQEKIPEGTFKIYKGTKLFAAGMGDMDDLLENPKLIGTLETLK